MNDDDRAIAEKMMGQGGRVTPDRSRKRCAQPVRQGEIVVCAKNDEDQRIPSTAASDPGSDQALKNGALHAPDVSGGGIFKGKPTMGGMCLLGGCPKAQPLIIDLSEIPEAPAGSEADRIAKGELRSP